MGFSRITFPGDGVTDTFNVVFALGFISEEDVRAYVEGELDGNGDQVDRPIDFLSPTTMRIGGDISSTAGRVITFDRTVEKEALLVDYIDGDIMNDENLNTSQKQMLMAVQELIDGRFNTFLQDLDLGGKRITNLGTPIDPTDAATKAYVDGLISTGLVNAIRAENAANQAEIYRNFAHLWAVAPVGTLVNDGFNPADFSAYHWSQLASEITIPDGTILTDKIADGAVTTPKIANGAVTRDKLAVGAVPPGLLYANVPELIAALHTEVSDKFKTLSLNEDNVSGSGVELSHAGTVNPIQPGQVSLDVEGVTHFYTRSNKILRPQQFGARSGGDLAINRAALIEMFSLADLTGRTIDMGDANDVYEIDDQIDQAWTRKPVIRGSGATIKLSRGGNAPSMYGLRFRTTDIGIDLEGFGVDGSFQTPNPFWIDSLGTSLVRGTECRLVGIRGNNGRRATTEDHAGRGVNVRGWFESLYAREVHCSEMQMAAGAGASGSHGIIGLFFGRDASNRYPLYKEIIDCSHGPITCDDPAWRDDMDGIAVFDALPAGAPSRVEGSTLIRGSRGRNAHGRFIKLQCSNVEVVEPMYFLDSAPTGGRINALCDFQNGEGRHKGGSAFLNNAAPVYAISGTARSYVAGNMVVEGLTMTGRGGGNSTFDSLVYRNADANHLPGNLTVRDCSTMWQEPTYGVTFVTRLASVERAVISGNSFRSMAAGGACARLTALAGATALATIKDNINVGPVRPLYHSSGTVTVQGAPADNYRFSDGTSV